MQETLLVLIVAEKYLPDKLSGGFEYSANIILKCIESGNKKTNRPLSRLDSVSTCQ